MKREDIWALVVRQAKVNKRPAFVAVQWCGLLQSFSTALWWANGEKREHGELIQKLLRKAKRWSVQYGIIYHNKNLDGVFVDTL